MNDKIMIRVSRDGVEIGSFPVKETIRLLVYGTLKDTDFYWHDGMDGWAPLKHLQAAEDRRQAELKSAKDKEEERMRAERLAHERAEAKAHELRAADAAREARLRSEREDYYRCHCCRASFQEPETPDSNTIFGVIMILGSGFASWVMFENGFDSYRSSSIKAMMVGQFIAIAVFFLGLVVVNVSSLKSPFCPKCRSTNFSRPEKRDE